VNLLAIFSAIASFLVFRDLPWTAVEKMHALATNETRYRKRRITPECCLFVKRPQTMSRYLSLVIVKGSEWVQGFCSENEGVLRGRSELVIRPPEPARRLRDVTSPSNGTV
jgi:hypothetical protein